MGILPPPLTLVPSVAWQQHLSDHFLVNYHDDTQTGDMTSGSFAEKFEEIHTQLETFFSMGSEPHRPIHPDG